MKRIHFYLLALISLFVEIAQAQVAINLDGATPNASAMLDVVSTTKGFLAPRMTQAQRNLISSPATGLMIYQTDNISGFYFNSGTPSSPVWNILLTDSSSLNYVDLTTAQTVAGAKSWSNLGTFNAGLTALGGGVNLNVNSNFATSFNTGTSTGAVYIANGTAGGNIIAIGNALGSTSIVQKVGTGNFSLDGAAASTYSIGASTTTGTITIGGTSQTGAINLGTGTGTQTINIGTGGTGIKTINIGTGAVANTVLIGNTTTNTSIGINVTSPTAQLHLGAGYTTASNGAPLKFTAGTNLTTPENGAVEYDGTNYYVTSNSTRYTLAKTLTTTTSLNFGNTPTNTSSDLTVTITGAALNDVVLLGIPNSAVNNNTCFSAWVSAKNTVKVRFNNYSSNPVNPGAGTFRITVLKY